MWLFFLGLRTVLENHFHPLTRLDGTAVNFARRKFRSHEGFACSLLECGGKSRLFGIDALNATLFVYEERKNANNAAGRYFARRRFEHDGRLGNGRCRQLVAWHEAIAVVFDRG
nr:hypothetical protein [Variovorax sp. VRV01]